MLFARATSCPAPQLLHDRLQLLDALPHLPHGLPTEQYLLHQFRGMLRDFALEVEQPVQVGEKRRHNLRPMDIGARLLPLKGSDGILYLGLAQWLLLAPA